MERIQDIPFTVLTKIIYESYGILVGEPKMRIEDVLDEMEVFNTCVLEIYRRQQLNQMEAV